ncbi:hypothetical protein [Carnimonas bestiolae]|uniref:hypothetical protein n=1 Tax=Carnimonas bestiolae TaxID=3402172 RepID=UPI003EDB7238
MDNSKKLKDRPSKAALIRIIGNAIPELHHSTQSVSNVKHIVERESTPSRFDKFFVLNRLVDKEEEKYLKDYLESNGFHVSVISFSLSAFKKVGYSLSAIPDAAFWFKKIGPWTQMFRNTAIRTKKNKYLMNNNGARNHALEMYRTRYEWISPWDGNCFLNGNAFAELADAFWGTKKKPSYVITPMQRVDETTDIANDSPITNAIEEPQISFHAESSQRFNENRVYGYQPKVELLKRLGVHGSWDEKKDLYPWKLLKVREAPDAGDFVWAAGVFRLFSGNAETVNNGASRSYTRGMGIVELIDRVEAVYVESNLRDQGRKQKVEQALRRRTLARAGASGAIPDANNQEDISLDKIKRAIRVTFANQEKISYPLETIPIYQENLSSRGLVLFWLKKRVMTLLAALNEGLFSRAVREKVDVVMLIFFLLQNRWQLPIKCKQEQEELALLIEWIDAIFKLLFSYDLASDLKAVGLSLDSINGPFYIRSYHGMFLALDNNKNKLCLCKREDSDSLLIFDKGKIKKQNGRQLFQLLPTMVGKAVRSKVDDQYNLNIRWHGEHFALMSNGLFLSDRRGRDLSFVDIVKSWELFELV